MAKPDNSAVLLDYNRPGIMFVHCKYCLRDYYSGDFGDGQSPSEVGIESNRLNRGPVQNAIEDHAGGVAPKRQRPSRHLVQHNAEREQVSALVEFLAPHLLRRHIGDGTQRQRPGW